MSALVRIGPEKPTRLHAASAELKPVCGGGASREGRGLAGGHWRAELCALRGHPGAQAGQRQDVAPLHRAVDDQTKTACNQPKKGK
jgi:hypothetical protein